MTEPASGAEEPDPGPAPRAAEPPQTLHTRYSRSLVFLALGTGAAGLALGNAVLLALAGTMAAFLHAARAGWPGRGELRTLVSSERVPRGSTLEVGYAASAGEATAVHLVHLPLPAPFTLEKGSNVDVLPPGTSATGRLTAGCPKRGAFALGPATLTALHPHLLAPSARIAVAEPADLVVEPRTKPLRRAKHLRGPARRSLGDDRGMRGPAGSDFRELRAYQRGDPLKAVNWKATAKRSAADLELMVNDFEPEARKNIWFFLDLGRGMEVGTTLENGLEDAIEATLALTHHFTSRGHRVGGTTFNAPPLVFYPEAGSRQQLTIARALAHAEASDQREGLVGAVERVRGFLARERPLVFVVTRPDLDAEGLAAGARRIQGLVASRTRPRPVFVLAPTPPAGNPAEALGRALRLMEARAALGAGTVRIVPLRLGVRSLVAALAKGVLAR